MDEADVRVLRALEERIDRAIRLHFTDRGKSAFLRLCGRSPKDAEPSPAKREQVRQTYEAELKRLLDAGEELCPNTKLRAIGRVPSWLCVSSGADAMSLLLTSERVFADMVDWTKWYPSSFSLASHHHLTDDWCDDCASSLSLWTGESQSRLSSGSGSPS